MLIYPQQQKLRVALFKGILKQEIGWFDTNETGQLNTRLSELVVAGFRRC